MSGAKPDENWEVVFYPSPLPSHYALVPLALLFDRVHVPGFLMPDLDVEPHEVLKAAETDPDMDNRTNLAIVQYALQYSHLKSFLYYPDNDGIQSEQGWQELCDKMLQASLPPDVYKATESIIGAHLTGIPATDLLAGGMTWPAYPANALLYAGRVGLPLLSDQEQPLPLLPSDETPQDTKSLAMILALQALRLALPLGAIPVEIKELKGVREELQPFLRPFRVSMIRLTSHLNDALVAGLPAKELLQVAEREVLANVYPNLVELENAIRSPKRSWHKTALDGSQLVLETIAAASTLPWNIAAAWTTLRATRLVVDSVRSKSTDDLSNVRTDLYYLVALKRIATR